MQTGSVLLDGYQALSRNLVAIKQEGQNAHDKYQCIASLANQITSLRRRLLTQINTVFTIDKVSATSSLIISRTFITNLWQFFGN